VLPELTHLAELADARERLDDRELTLIDRARTGGATWSQVAAALGLASRQAAEQRRQRLAAAARLRRQRTDRAYAPPIAEIRDAVAHLDRWIRADRRWAKRFRRADLVRSTIAAALDAPPGPLHTLAGHIADDLAAVRAERLPPPVHEAVRALREALSTNH
jgi:hypothetical protein